MLIFKSKVYPGPCGGHHARANGRRLWLMAFIGHYDLPEGYDFDFLIHDTYGPNRLKVEKVGHRRWHLDNGKCEYFGLSLFGYLDSLGLTKVYLSFEI